MSVYSLQNTFLFLLYIKCFNSISTCEAKCESLRAELWVEFLVFNAIKITLNNFVTLIITAFQYSTVEHFRTSTNFAVFLDFRSILSLWLRLFLPWRHYVFRLFVCLYICPLLYLPYFSNSLRDLL